MALLIISCTEDVVNVTPSSDSNAEDLVTVTPSSASASTLKFDDTDHIFKYFNSTVNEQDFTSNRTILHNESEFKSFKEVYHTALEELEAIETLEQHDAFLKRYSDVLKVIDSTYVPKIASPLYQAICNRDGIYESEGYVHKIIDSEYMIITKSENIDALQKIHSTNNINPKGFRVVPYNATGIQNKQNRQTASCGSIVEKNYFNNNKKCKDDRKVYVKGLTDFIVSGNNFTPRAFAVAYGTKRNSFCNWKEYKTALATRNCSFTVTATLNGTDYNYSKSFYDQSTTSDSYKILLYNALLTSSPIPWQEGETLSIEFTKINLEATSRGVGNNWVKLNCQ